MGVPEFGNKVANIVSRLNTLGPGLPNLQKGDNLATRVNLLTMFATLFPNSGTHILYKGPGEGVDYLKISGMLNL